MDTPGNEELMYKFNLFMTYNIILKETHPL